jgi:hypothetical protein
MIYVKNIKSYISDELIQHMLTHDGARKPDEVSDYQKPILDKWISSGIDTSKVGWEFFNSDNLVENLDLPFVGNVRWWFSKLNPGDMFPLHLDTYPEQAQIERYWVACQDHQSGHVFMSGDTVLQNYSAGDVFKFESTDTWHGACNLGFTPKISLQILVTL